jgi:Ser/Thr protein kinase RdoA (MazF antagonist)
MTDFDRRERRLRDVCTAWLGSRPVVIEPLASEGFSGASIARVRGIDEADAWVLKSFPRSRVEHVGWVHSLMRHVRGAGAAEVPDVAVTSAGASMIVDPDGDAWELVAFVAGASTATPTVAQTAAAATCLARIHLAAATLPGAEPSRAVPGAITRRIAHAAQLLDAPWSGRRVQRPAGPRAWHDDLLARRDRARAIFAATHGARALERVAARVPSPARVQAVLRDVTSDHVLYRQADSAVVAGVIDFHAAAIDTPATDLARLLGSWRPACDHGRWEAALAAYEAVRPLEVSERLDVAWLDATGVIFGLDHWFRWTLDEARPFREPVAVLARIDALLERLEESVADLHDGGGHAV